jgi:hypothetical protein
LQARVRRPAAAFRHARTRLFEVFAARGELRERSASARAAGPQSSPGSGRARGCSARRRGRRTGVRDGSRAPISGIRRRSAVRGNARAAVGATRTTFHSGAARDGPRAHDSRQNPRLDSHHEVNGKPGGLECRPGPAFV